MQKRNVKAIVLIMLVLQNALTALLARQSRMPNPSGAPLYLGSVAVLVAEIMKLPVCLVLIARDEGGPLKMVSRLYKELVVKWKSTVRMGVPALCYCLQNALFFVALSRLSATSYQLWSQSKTIFTAFFFVSVLGRTLSKQQVNNKKELRSPSPRARTRTHSSPSPSLARAILWHGTP